MGDHQDALGIGRVHTCSPYDRPLAIRTEARGPRLPMDAEKRRPRRDAVRAERDRKSVGPRTRIVGYSRRDFVSADLRTPSGGALLTTTYFPGFARALGRPVKGAALGFPNRGMPATYYI